MTVALSRCHDMEFFGLPQPLNGTELVTIAQEQNGNWAHCSMPLSQLASLLGTNWSTLPTQKPAVPGVLWNDGGSISLS